MRYAGPRSCPHCGGTVAEQRWLPAAVCGAKTGACGGASWCPICGTTLSTGSAVNRRAADSSTYLRSHIHSNESPLLPVDCRLPWNLREMANAVRKRALSPDAQRVAAVPGGRRLGPFRPVLSDSPIRQHVRLTGGPKGGEAGALATRGLRMHAFKTSSRLILHETRLVRQDSDETRLGQPAKHCRGYNQGDKCGSLQEHGSAPMKSPLRSGWAGWRRCTWREMPGMIGQWRSRCSRMRNPRPTAWRDSSAKFASRRSLPIRTFCH
jgi:hypothetical protein